MAKRPRGRPTAKRKRWGGNLRRAVIAPLALAAALSLGWAILELPAPQIDLAAQVQANLPGSGVSQPITAVLLNFRSYDTLLEVAVLLIALISIWSLRLEMPEVAGPVAATKPILTALVRLLAPLMVLVAGYLLWAGSSLPGGAFQSGAVLGALGELLLLAALFRTGFRRVWPLRLLLTLGFGVFLAVAVGALAFGGALLEYPAGTAYPAILLIETLLAVSIGLTLALLFLGADPVSAAHGEAAREGTREPAPEEGAGA